MAALDLTTTATVPSGSTLSVTVEEDADGDGVFENAATTTVPDGTETQTLEGFDASEGNDIRVRRNYEYSVGDGMTLESASVTPGTVALVWDTEADWNAAQKDGIQVNGSTFTLASAIPDSGVSRWTFDSANTNSGTAVDVWGGNDGTISGATTGVSGANQTYTTNEAYSFDSVDDYVEGEHFSALSADSNSEISVAAWVKPLSEAGDDDQRNIFAHQDGTGGWFFRLESNNEPVLRMWGDNSKGSSISLPVGEWSHVGFSWDCGSYVDIYLNGSSPYTYTSSDTSDTTLPWTIGKDRATSDQVFDGPIDDVRLYNRVLTSTEWSNLYQTGSING